MNFLMLKLPGFDYADQTKISNERVDPANACTIHYGLHTGMVFDISRENMLERVEMQTQSLSQSPPTLQKRLRSYRAHHQPMLPILPRL